MPLLIAGLIHLALVCIPGTVHAATFADPAFERVWRRIDAPVLGGAVARTWIWGPEPRSGAETERYREAPGGMRLVQYFDKSRMELTDPHRNPADPYYVTNGLLATELVTGRLQLGDNDFEQHMPSMIPVAGDADDPAGPTYATFGPLRTVPATAVNTPITATLTREGTVGNDPSLKGRATAQTYVPETQHTVADVFWQFMNAAGPVDGGTSEPLFRSPFYATGFPISEAYWTTVRVAGQNRQVLIQVFERRVLTFTPGNPPGFTVEAGNVGLHYRMWRAGLTGPTDTSTPAPVTASTTTMTGVSAPAASNTQSRAALIVDVTPGGIGGDATNEHITIVNGTDHPLNLTGWTLADTHNHVYTFSPLTLAVDASVTVHTGTGADTATDRYWKLPAAVLTTSGTETISLRDANGSLVDSYPYP